MKLWMLNAAVLTTVAGLSVGCSHDHKGHDEHGKMEKKGESEMKLTDLPAPVQAAVATATAAYPGAKVEEISKEEEEGKTAYEVGFEAAEVDHSLKVAPDGTVLEEETEVELTALPPVITAAVKAKYPAGKIKEANTVRGAGKTYYEVVVKMEKAKHELKLTADGAIVEDETVKGEHKDHDEKDEKDEKDQKGK